MTSDGMKRTYRAGGNGALVRCDRCGKVGRASAPSGAARAILRVHCRCGNSFEVVFDRRALFRRTTRLAGRYLRAAPTEEQGPMTVVDLSLGGLGFTAEEPHGLAVGDTIIVEFASSSAEGAMERRRAVVRRVNEEHVGVEFIDDAPAPGAAAKRPG